MSGVQLWRVREPYSLDLDGVPTVVTAGTLLTADDPRLLGREVFCEPAVDAARPPGTVLPEPPIATAERDGSETASAGPSHRRSIKRARTRHTTTEGTDG